MRAIQIIIYFFQLCAVKRSLGIFLAYGIMKSGKKNNVVNKKHKMVKYLTLQEVKCLLLIHICYMRKYCDQVTYFEWFRYMCLLVSILLADVVEFLACFSSYSNQTHQPGHREGHLLFVSKDWETLTQGFEDWFCCCIFFFWERAIQDTAENM